VRASSGLTGHQAAQRLISTGSLYGLQIQDTAGQLSDHYDPRNNTLFLSPGVANSPSVAAVAIAAHELGHALQDAEEYFPMKIRSALVPAVNIGSNLGWFLIITAVFFGFLWLSEDVPALLAGRMPQSVTDMALPTNPVHVLDLAFFLPAVIATGVLLLRGKPLAHTVAPSMIVFLVLTGVPILLTPVVQAMRGQAAAWGVVVPIGTLTLALIALLTWLMSSIRTDE